MRGTYLDSSGQRIGGEPWEKRAATKKHGKKQDGIWKNHDSTKIFEHQYLHFRSFQCNFHPFGTVPIVVPCWVSWGEGISKFKQSKTASVPHPQTSVDGEVDMGLLPKHRHRNNIEQYE